MSLVSRARPTSPPSAAHVTEFGIAVNESCHGTSGPIQSGYPSYLYTIVENWIPTWVRELSSPLSTLLALSLADGRVLRRWLSASPLSTFTLARPAASTSRRAASGRATRRGPTRRLATLTLSLVNPREKTLGSELRLTFTASFPFYSLSRLQPVSSSLPPSSIIRSRY